MANCLVVSKKALKELEAISEPYYTKIYKAIASLEHNTLPAGVKKLVGSMASYRIRVADYRILYTLTPGQVTIFSVAHRREAYR